MRYDRSKSNNGSSPVKVLVLVGGDIAAQVESELESSGNEVVLERVDSLDDLAGAVRRFHPDVILSDNASETLSSWRVLEQLRTEGLHIPVIAITPQIVEDRALRALRAGADNIVVQGNLARLAPAIDEALRIRQPLGRLSPRQLEVLRQVSEGLPMRVIAERMGLSIKTVETHRGEIVRRLGIRDVAGLVRYAVRVGLVTATPALTGDSSPELISAFEDR